MALKYKAGDQVRIKSIDWYNENKNVDGIVELSTHVFVPGMSKYCGMIVTIDDVFEDTDGNVAYYMDGIDWDWTDEMIECKVEEENIDCEKCGLTRNSTRCLFMDNCPHNKQKTIIEIPEDWVLKDENDNEILTSKIILEKKKKEVTYPKTYEDCLKILGFTTVYTPKIEPMFDYDDDIIALQKLKNCRDAYWKIAGEEMGLGKPWEPDWTANDNHFYTIHTFNGKIECSTTAHRNAVLIFPTAEMRDAFYENFKELIEICKELL